MIAGYQGSSSFMTDNGINSVFIYQKKKSVESFVVFLNSDNKLLLQVSASTFRMIIVAGIPPQTQSAGVVESLRRSGRVKESKIWCWELAQRRVGYRAYARRLLYVCTWGLYSTWFKQRGSRMERDIEGLTESTSVPTTAAPSHTPAASQPLERPIRGKVCYTTRWELWKMACRVD